MAMTKLHDACVFALADEFDDILRYLSVEFLRTAWERLHDILRSERLEIADLRWGMLHPGVTLIDLPDNPIAYFGWISTQTLPLDPQEELFRVLGQKLMQGTPKLQWGASNRGWDFEIEPDNFTAGLQACIEIGTDEVNCWDPEGIVDTDKLHEPWRLAAKSIQDQDHNAFTSALKIAEATYSPHGFRLMKEGFDLWNRNGIRPLRQVISTQNGE